MKETKEMMKTLSKNKKKIQERKKQLKTEKEKAKDITYSIWMAIGFLLIVLLIAQI